MARTTIGLAELIDRANVVMEKSKPDMVQGREAIAQFVHQILLDSDMYAGFNYLHGYNKGDNSRIVTFKNRKLASKN